MQKKAMNSVVCILIDLGILIVPTYSKLLYYSVLSN